MGLNIEHQDGMIAKYLISKGLPESVEITTKRLARYCASQLSPEVLSKLSQDEIKELNLKGYLSRLRYKARDDLRNAYRMQKLVISGKVYRIRRVEDWPEYRIALELEELNDNGAR